MNVAHAADVAFAQGFGGMGGSALFSQFGSLIPFVAIFLIFYFLLIRPQQKQRREREQMLSAVKRGDRVVTSGGLHGTVTGLSDQVVTVRIADQVKVDVDRSAISRIVEVSGEKAARDA
jgi:preprotein translocase subunit YajC